MFFLLFAAAVYPVYDAWRFCATPAEPASPRNIIIEIQPGATFARTARDLFKANAITSVWRFRLLAQVQKKLNAIQAGEFQVNTGWLPDKILQHLVSGKPLLYRLALREGLTWREVAKQVEDGGFARADAFAAVIHDPKFLLEYGIPFSNAEGFLLPETYLLHKPKTPGDRDQAEAVARMLLENFWQRFRPLLSAHPAPPLAPNATPVLIPSLTARNGVITAMPSKPASVGTESKRGTNAAATANATEQAVMDIPQPLQLPISVTTLRQIVILASLVEKETSVPEERARVAGVYANRLRLGMLLQCDPTIIYGLGESFSGPLRRSHLNDTTNPYNTYQHAGLPPGPIASPGVESLRAALAPEEHNFLYFVAIGEGGKHAFTTNLSDHNKAVERYRAVERSRRNGKIMRQEGP